jgi:hypothetical protein
MNICKPRIINERIDTIPIPILKISPTNKKIDFNLNEYSLTQNIFDPSKSSPPNEFMLKLQLRMTLYDSFIKEDNLIKE